MLAKKADRGDKKPVVRNKEAKVASIVDAAVDLVGTMGYDKVTVRDIAEAAGVSVGLIYKYFPGGKFDVIIRGHGSRTLGELLTPTQPETVDYGDFPGYVRAIILQYQHLIRDYDSLVKAMISSALEGGELLDGMDNVGPKDLAAVGEFFGRFEGVDTKGKDPGAVFLKWGVMLKGILIFNLLYPMPLLDDEAITALLVDLSLALWGHKNKEL